MLGGMSNPASPQLAEQWRQILQRQRASGLSIAQFCRRERLTESSFFLWKRRLRVITPSGTALTAPDVAATSASAMFVEATPATTAGCAQGHRESPIELCLRGGRILRLHSGFDPELLINLLRLLESLAGSPCPPSPTWMITHLCASGCRFYATSLCRLMRQSRHATWARPDAVGTRQSSLRACKA
jgi:putative transposase